MSTGPDDEADGTSPDALDTYWKLAEQERHFNIIAAGLRGLASVWLLATFGAIAVLLERTERVGYAINEDLLIAAVCFLGATGLALLWEIDTRVYHRLLDAVFIVGLNMEFHDPRLPPIHASMMSTSKAVRWRVRLRHPRRRVADCKPMPDSVLDTKVGFGDSLGIFYKLPIVALCAGAAGVTIAYGVRDGRPFAVLLAFAALLPVLLVFRVVTEGSAEDFPARAEGFGDPRFAQIVASQAFEGMLAQFAGRDHAQGVPARAKPDEGKRQDENPRPAE